MRTVTKVVRMESAGLLKESSNESYLNESTGMSIYVTLFALFKLNLGICANFSVLYLLG